MIWINIVSVLPFTVRLSVFSSCFVSKFKNCKIMKRDKTVNNWKFFQESISLGYAQYNFLLICLLKCRLVFKDQPRNPPSKARALRKFNHSTLDNPIHSLRRLIKNKNLLILLVTYGINVGILNTISNMLNPIYLEQFEVSGSKKKTFELIQEIVQ